MQADTFWFVWSLKLRRVQSIQYINIPNDLSFTINGMLNS